MQIEDIKKLLPHRYPYLLVDRVAAAAVTWWIGWSNWSWVNVSSPIKI